MRAGVLLPVVLLLSCIFPAGGARAAGPSLETRREIRVLIRPKAALASQVAGKDGPHAAGLAVNVLEAVAGPVGLKLAWVEIPPDADVGEALRSGKGDLVVDWGYTDERAREFLFSDPYLTIPVNIIVRKEESRRIEPDSLGGLRIAVVARNISDVLLSPRTDIRLYRYSSIYDAMFGLLSGNVDAVAHLGPILMKEAQISGVADRLRVLEPPIASSPRTFVMRKGEEVTIAALDRELARFVVTPEYRKLHDRWFEKPAPYWNARRILLANLAFLALVVAVMAAWRYVTLLKASRRVAEGKAAEARARASESIALLAGGIAHNLNNLLMIIAGNAEIVRESTSEGGPGRRNIDEVLGAADRAASLTAKLLAFSRQSVFFRKVDRIDAFVAAALPAVREVLGAGVEVEVERGAGDAKVSVDPGQFEAMLREIVKNAHEAMPEGGKVRIATSRAEVVLPEEGGGEGVGLPPGSYAVLTVADTGCGMDAATLAHVFDPFLTTKEFGRGMGLPAVYGFVKRCEGTVDVSSEAGKGTTVTIRLPLAGGGAAGQ